MANGPAGPAKLAAGPNLASYRGLQIINTRKFSMESGTAPRDLLRRRVRVAEYYRVPWHPQNPSRSYEFYDQSRDTMFRMTWKELLEIWTLVIWMWIVRLLFRVFGLYVWMIRKQRISKRRCFG